MGTAVALAGLLSICAFKNDQKILEGLIQYAKENTHILLETQKNVSHEKYVPCKKALETYWQYKGRTSTDDLHRLLFLQMAFLSDISEIQKELELEISLGNGLVYTDSLRKLSPQKFLVFVKNYMSEKVSLLRKEWKLNEVSLERYGKGSQKPPQIETKDVMDPVLFKQWLEFLLSFHKEISSKDIKNINFIYAFSPKDSRSILNALVSGFISRRSEDWILAFRGESLWVQLNLLDVMRDSQEMKALKELVWISEYHDYDMMRFMAKDVLEK